MRPGNFGNVHSPFLHTFPVHPPMKKLPEPTTLGYPQITIFQAKNLTTRLPGQCHRLAAHEVPSWSPEPHSEVSVVQGEVRKVFEIPEIPGK